LVRVRGGMTVAVYAEDDEGGNKYYLIRVGSRSYCLIGWCSTTT
jgi:hypothetical protein